MMKKIFIKLTMVVIGCLLFTACETDSTDGVSSVTNYPEFTLQGDEVIMLKMGETFTDPGVIVTEGGSPIEYTTSVSGRYRGGNTLDTNKADIYSVTYTAINKDGFAGTASRSVIVVDDGDLVNSISGLYTSDCTRNGTISAQYKNMKYVMIWQNTDGTYEISDGIGLYYSVGRAYGDAYLARPVIVKANSIPNNDFIISPFTVGGFGGGCVMSGLNANPTAQTVSFSTVWTSGYTFDVLLKKVKI